MGDRMGRERDTTKDDDTDVTRAHDTGSNAGGQTKYTNAGAIPSVMGFPQSKQAPTASERAFGALQPSSDDMQALGDRMEAERLLTSKDVTSGQDAIRGLDILLGQPTVVDKLSQRAFDNLLDRLSEDQRARMAPLVDASQDPKRKLKLWAAQHKGRAHADLSKYADYSNVDGQLTADQLASQKRHDRRERGVDSDGAEVKMECELLLAKGDKLTIKDVDDVRARKDKELDVEMKHNVNLVAEGDKRGDDTRVVWSESEVGQLDSSLSKLPDDHVHDENSVEKYIRRANRLQTPTRGGDYVHNEISIYDHSHDAISGRAEVNSVEYDVTHEVGHEVATEHQTAFAKFEKASGWETYKDRDVLEAKRIPDQVIDQMGDAPQVVSNKVYKKQDDGSYASADETAIPAFGDTNSDRWKYAASNSAEHWAEVYAMAVETPELLYSDLIEMPANRVRILRESLGGLQNAMRNAGTNSQKSLDIAMKMQQTEQKLERAEKVVKQRREIYDIMRNDVFHGEQNTRAAVERLKKKGADDGAIRAFEEKAARASTPQQIAELEREAMR